MDASAAQTDSTAGPAPPSAMRQTVPVEAFSAEGMRAHLARTGSAAAPAMPDPRAGTAPLLARPSLAESLRRFGVRAPGPPQPRFEVERVLGVGATARVFAVLDRNLDRAVAVKFLSDAVAGADLDSVEHFVQEAQITASLEHPNVLPVHELDVNDAGQVYFTMKKIDGRSLGALIEQSAPGSRVAPLDDFNALVNLMLGVCQALAYAHARGVVHQDVKPENIMVGDFGEVLLVDWGSAARVRGGAEPRLYGTPLYMSPEQARREGVDERSDVYCVGATLFHALTLRPPTWSDDAEEFWRLKREGVIQPPTPEELARVPRPLLDIALKALAREPKDRYAGAAELLADLRSYQAGLAVSAHRDSWLELLARWHRRHWRALWGTTAVAAVVLTLGAALYGEKLKEIATWGAPKVEERFTDDGWQSRWKLLAGGFALRDGSLVATGGGASMLAWPEKLWGPVAIEYTAECLPDAQPGDLSAFWARDLKPGDPDHALVDGFAFQVGAFDGAYTAIRTSAGRHLASDYFRPEPGRRYRIRAEVDEYRVTLAVDGRVVCRWTDTLRLDGGYLGLMAFYPGKAFSDVRIYCRGVAQKVPATAVGDAIMRLAASSDPALRAQLYGEALGQYERVTVSQRGTALEREARFKEGLCDWEQGRREEAIAAWQPLAADQLYGPQVELYRIERSFDDGDRAGALSALEALYRRGDADLRARVAMEWGRYVDRIRDERGKEKDRARLAALTQELSAWLAVHDRAFPDEKAVDVNAADALCDLGRLEELLRRYPQQRRLCVTALDRLGRVHEIVERYPDQVTGYRMACFQTGEFERYWKLPPDDFIIDEVRVKSGHPEDVPASSKSRFARWMATVALGRGDEALEAFRDDAWLRGMTLCLFGREQEAALDEVGEMRLMARLLMGEPRTVLATADPGSREHRYAQALIALDAYRRGDAADGARDLADMRVEPTNFHFAFVTCFVAPFLAHPRDPGAWARAAEPVLAERWRGEQVPWYMASYIQGATTEAAFLAQPHRLHADARLLLFRAFRADREERAADAARDYRAYLALPRWRRDTDPDPVAEAFAAWRAEVLGGR